MATVKTLIGNIKGTKGDKGDTGATGAQGPAGARGATGATGSTGPQGIQGIKGDTGATGPVGAKGATGASGATGPTGQRGSRWTQGTAITGTSTTATIFSGSGITDALVNDSYLNTSNGNTYRCTEAGNAATAKWVYSGCIRGATGPTGNTGAQGPTGATGNTGPQGSQGIQGNTGPAGQRGSKWYTGTAITGTSTTATIFSGSGITAAIIDDQYLNISIGNTYRCTLAGNAATARWVYTGCLKGATGNTGPTGQIGPIGPMGPKGDSGGFYGVCFTDASVQAKTVKIAGFTSAHLKEGTTICINFSNECKADRPTLNINNTGAVDIYYGSQYAYSGQTWWDKETVSFVYDGARWKIVRPSIATSNGNYGMVKLSSNIDSSEASEGVAVSQHAAYTLKKRIDEINSNLTYNQNTDITINTSVLNAYQSVSARRSVNTVTLKIFGALATYAQNKEYKVATIINENIKPIETVYLTAPMVSGAAVSTGTCMVSIKTNGDVTIMPQQSDCNWIYAHVTFVI